MPDMDGIEAARRIRALYPQDARPAEGRPPIVALTANAFAEDRDAYLRRGWTIISPSRSRRPISAALFARWRRPKAQRDGRAASAPPDARWPNAPTSCALSPDCHIEFELVC